MKFFHKIVHIISKAFAPLQANASFFFFMYLLGILVAYEELPTHNPTAKVYGNLWLELFWDLYIICFILALIPLKIRRWIRGFLYFIAYATSIADLFCWVKFQTTINPSMLLLAGETDGREAGEFLNSYLTADLLTSSVGVVFLLILIHLLTAFWPCVSRRSKLISRLKNKIQAHRSALFYTKGVLGAVCVVFVIWGSIAAANNKKMLWRMFSLQTIGQVEHELAITERNMDNRVQFYLPIYRLAFAIYSNELASHQIDQLIETKDHVQVDSCSYTSPNIVLIIGESYGKYHSQQYGYFMPTTPRQIKLEKQGLLVPFTDVVSPYNLTSFVFKNIFSLQVLGDKKDWCDYPLFPEVFRKAGYHVTFITNQFLPRVGQAVYDFSGGFFLNHPELSAAMFDARNTKLYNFDRGLLDDYDHKQQQYNKENNLIIFHLIGQHVNYGKRYPANQKHFTEVDYREKRPDLKKKARMILADYDNATLYNDSIVNEIVNRFKEKEAIVIYMPDHGDECYEGRRNFFCRNHSAAIDYNLARYEFEIPFWIYCSPKYKAKHPEIFQQIKEARKRKFMTDALPQMLLYLGGIHSKDYRSQYNILSPDYNENRPRLLKGTTDYDKLDKNNFEPQIPVLSNSSKKKK